MNAAEDDRPAFGLRRLAREPERVAHVVSDVLDLGQLVVVSEDHRLARTRERTNLVLKGRGQGSSTSIDTSSERAECVNAPIEIASTPVSA